MSLPLFPRKTRRVTGVWVIIAASHMACGRFGYYPEDSARGDAGALDVAHQDATLEVIEPRDVNTPDAQDSGAPDAVTDARLPDPDLDRVLGPWSAPALVPMINSDDNNDDPSLTGDLLEIAFNSDRTGNGDIYYATRAQSTDPWPTPTLLAAASGTASETAPKLSLDGLTLYFNSDRAAPGMGGDVYVCTRADRASAWGAATLVPEFSTPTYDSPPTLYAAGTRGILSSTSGTTNGADDLFSITRGSNGWSPLAPIAELITSSAERQPYTQDGLLVFFDSDRTANNFELYRTTRLTAQEAFSTPVPITELNSAASDQDIWVSPDLRTVYFSSNRTGRQQIYSAAR